MSEVKTEAAMQVVDGDKLPDLMTPAAIKHDQDSIRKSLLKLDFSIHANATQCLMHAEKHGDTSLMRRLLTDIIDAKSGYRRQGVIAWMREFSPMELKGDVIQLTGLKDGERRPFRCAEAHKTPFTTMAGAREMVAMRPIFRDNLTSKIDRALKEYKAAIENTLIVPGQAPAPKDPKKPFYNGIHLDKMDEGFDKIESVLAELTSFGDSTKEVYTNRENLKRAELAVQAEATSK